MKGAPEHIKHQRTRRAIGASLGCLAALWLMLLIPDGQPGGINGAGKQAFVWDQDAFWSELERQFQTARAAGCDSLTHAIRESMARTGELLQRIAETELPPNAAEFFGLETNLFRLAPLVAACPEFLRDYTGLMTQTRIVVKKQSERWELSSSAARQTLYRLLAGGRMAWEQVLLQASPGAVNELTLCQEAPSATPALTVQGVKLHSGDILLSRGGAPTSALIARGNDFPGSFSHAALLHVSAAGQASVIESHIECGVAVASLEEYLRDKKLRIMVMRPRADLPALQANPLLPHQAATAALEETRRRHIPYDFAMNFHDPGAQFCSEVASAAYGRYDLKLWMAMSSISSPTVSAWLGSLGVRHFETQEPADLEYDPQLRVVAEWRDRETLFKGCVDDAVTDVMLDSAPSGEPLPYSRLALPAARVGKAYSWLLNRCGKTGPVPEGMSATSALRVSRYRQEHTAHAARLLDQATQFEREKGYPPPYWELVRLARESADSPRRQIH